MQFILNAAMVNALVASLLACAAAAAARRWTHPSLCCVLWTLVLMKFVAPPIFFASIQTSMAGEASPLVGSNGAPVEPTSPVVAGFPWTSCIVSAWAAGTLFMLISAAVRMRRFHFLLQRAASAGSGVQAEVQQLAAKMGVKSVPVVKMIQGRAAPLVWAFSTTPVILLPYGLLNRLSPDERKTMLAHELAHLARRDHWLRMLELVVASIYWWNPVAWFARKELQHACELCCDMRVIRTLPRHARDYGEALLKTVDYLSETRSYVLPAGASGIGPTHRFLGRMEMILDRPDVNTLSWKARWLLAAAALLVLPLSVHGGEAGEPAEPDARPDELRAVIARPGGNSEEVVLKRNQDGYYYYESEGGTLRAGPRLPSELTLQEKAENYRKRMKDYEKNGRKQIAERVKQLEKEGKQEESQRLQARFWDELAAGQIRGLHLELALERERREQEKETLDGMRNEVQELRREIQRLAKLVGDGE